KTLSKNAILINGQGQPAQDKQAKGKITGYRAEPGYVWVQGDATRAYRANPRLSMAESVQRDMVMLESGLVIMRDEVVLTEPGTVQGLLHSMEKPDIHEEGGELIFPSGGKRLVVQVRSHNSPFEDEATDDFAIVVDPKDLEK